MEDIHKDTEDLKDSINLILRKLKGDTHSRGLNRNLLLDLIRLTAPITTYKLSKITGFSYTSIKDVIRTFEFSGLIKYKVVLGDNNRTHKLLCIPEEEAENDT